MVDEEQECVVEPAVRYHRLPPVDTHPITVAEIEQLRRPDGSSLAAGITTFFLGAGASGLFSMLAAAPPNPMTARYFALIASTIGFMLIGLVALLVRLLLPNRKSTLLEDVRNRTLPMPGQGEGHQRESRLLPGEDQ